MTSLAPTVLIVDDEPRLRSLLGILLQRAGLEVIIAADGEEALLILEQGAAVSVVVSDVQMPRMDGLTLSRELARLHPELPVILMSAAIHPLLRAWEGSAARAFLAKPFQPADILEIINAILNSSPQRSRGAVSAAC